MLTRDDLLGRTQPRYREVTLPDGTTCRIRNLSESQRSDFEASILTKGGKFSLAAVRRQRRRLIALCLVDCHGQRLLDDEDAERLAAVDGAITGMLYDECRKHCGFDEEDIEELVKNSAEIHEGATPIDSLES